MFREPAIVLRAPLLAGLGVDGGRSAVLLDHHSIGADVNPPRVGVTRHHRDAGADVASAVVFVPKRGREAREVNVAASDDVLEDRPPLEHLRLEARRGGFPLARFAAKRLDEPDCVEPWVEAEGDRHPARVAEGTGQHPVPAWIADDVIEQESRRGLPAVIDLRDRADLAVPVGTGDVLQLPQALDSRNPTAELGRPGGGGTRARPPGQGRRRCSCQLLRARQEPV